MHLATNTELNNLTLAELTEAYKKIDSTDYTDYTPDQLHNLLAVSKRQLSLVIWYDHATDLNTGFIMVTMHIQCYQARE